MALKKKSVTKKTVAKTTVATPPKAEIKTITKTITPSMDDIILGAKPESKEVTIYDVFDRHVFFEVENVEQQTKNRVSGKIVETLFGTNSREEKEKLQEGANEVIIKDSYHQKALYIIRKV